MNKICIICNDKVINSSNRCKKCKKSVCNECYCKMSNLINNDDIVNIYYFNYCCPFCRYEELQETETMDGKIIIKILGNNFNDALKTMKDDYSGLLMSLEVEKEYEIEKIEKKIDTYKSITEYYKKKNIELVKENEKLKKESHDEIVINRFKEYLHKNHRKTLKLEDLDKILK